MRHCSLVSAAGSAALLLLSGCAQTFDATKVGVPVEMAAGAAPAQGTPFKLTGHAVFAFWGLARVSEPSLQKALATQLVGGSGISDLRIRVRSRFADLLITGLTLGLIAPRSVTFEGVVTAK